MVHQAAQYNHAQFIIDSLFTPRPDSHQSRESLTQLGMLECPIG